MQLLRSSVALSRHQPLQLTLLDDEEARYADVILMPGDKAEQRRGLLAPWTDDAKVVWLGGPPAPVGQYLIERPVPWSNLSNVLGRLLGITPVQTGTTPPRTGKPSVLVVDDSVVTRNHLMGALVPAGFDAMEADCGEAALTLLRSHRFHCVLLDVVMPGIDGYDTCRSIKNTYVGQRQTAVVMLTSRSSPFDRIRGKFAGCDAYLTKPVELEQLRATLARFIPADLHSQGGVRSPRIRPA